MSYSLLLKMLWLQDQRIFGGCPLIDNWLDLSIPFTYYSIIVSQLQDVVNCSSVLRGQILCVTSSYRESHFGRCEQMCAGPTRGRCWYTRSHCRSNSWPIIPSVQCCWSRNGQLWARNLHRTSSWSSQSVTGPRLVYWSNFCHCNIFIAWICEVEVRKKNVEEY